MKALEFYRNILQVIGELLFRQILIKIWYGAISIFLNTIWFDTERPGQGFDQIHNNKSTLKSHPLLKWTLVIDNCIQYCETLRLISPVFVKWEKQTQNSAVIWWIVLAPFFFFLAQEYTFSQVCTNLLRLYNLPFFLNNWIQMIECPDLKSHHTWKWRVREWKSQIHWRIIMRPDGMNQVGN